MGLGWGPLLGAPVLGWDRGPAGADVWDFPSEPLELEGEGGDWYLVEEEWLTLAPTLECDPGWE